MRIRIILLMFFILQFSWYSSAQHYRKDYNYLKYDISDKDFRKLLDRIFEDFKECINDSVKLVLQIEANYNAYSEKIDTVLFFELSPVFTWSDVGANFSGVLMTKSSYVLLKESDPGFWIKAGTDSVSLKQRVLRRFGMKEPNSSDFILPNNIYPTIPCIYRYENGCFIKSKKYDCYCTL